MSIFYNLPDGKPEAHALKPRYSEVGQQKSAGVTYTPLGLASFVAEQIVLAAEAAGSLPKSGPIRMLDPAVGDGALLDSLILHLPEAERNRVQVYGFDTDPDAIQIAQSRLTKAYPNLKMEFKVGNFLEHVLASYADADLLTAASERELFHLVIANPPYVRTQIMGSGKAQELAKAFGLTGRVDLYYPFMLGISRVLAANGIAGVITSNRFMTTKSGRAVRRALLSNFDILHIWDLGDTKLFDAAVLPSVMLARAMAHSQKPLTEAIRFSSIYASAEVADSSKLDALTALSCANGSVVGIADGRKFRVQHGNLDNGGDPEGVWRIGTAASDNWLATVQANTWANFGCIGKIKVGVKSTADKVFIRSDWENLDGGVPELLRPLITRHCARRFKAQLPVKMEQRKKILYPHETTAQGRAAVDLALYPRAKRYLEQFRATLEKRDYLMNAGRNWYELWVPHDPSAWASPKLVFRDISVEPVFWMDTDGGVVNGECYWLRCEKNVPQDLLWLALAVANSTFIEFFYDKCFNNKLYAGRRRFMAQYVEQFPLPDPMRVEAREMVAIVKEIHAQTPSATAELMAQDLDARVWQIFGLSKIPKEFGFLTIGEGPVSTPTHLIN